MKICYVTTYDARDLRQWSGLGSFIARTLAEHGAELDYCGPLHSERSLVAKAEQLYCQRVAKKIHVRGREPWQIKNYARQVEQHIERTKPDVIFSPGTIPISLINVKQPIVFWTDATFASLVDFYPGYCNLCSHTLRDGNAMEKAALDRSRLAIYSSEWAARSAIEKYGAATEKVRVVLFGANIEAPPSGDRLRRAIEQRGSGRCRLLFVSSDWARKGGDSVLAVMDALKLRRIDAELAIVGERPPEGKRLAPGTRLLGYLDKNSAEGKAQIQKEFEQAHFLLLPSIAECCAVVVAEANAFGVPCVTTDVGGTSTAVRNDVNGHMYSLGSYAEQAAGYIVDLFANPDRYRALAETSRREYDLRLNWETAGEQAWKLILSVA